MAWHRSLLHVVNQAKERGIIIYGAGFWGEIAYNILLQFDVSPLCYSDDNIEKQGKTHCGVNIYSLEESVEKYPQAVYVVCVDETPSVAGWDSRIRSAMINRLKKFDVYDDNTEIHFDYYVFLLDVGKDAVYQKDNIKEIVINEDKFYWSKIKKVMVLNHMANSGSMYLEELMDSSKCMLCVPFFHSIDAVYKNRLQYLKDEELIIEIMAQLMGYFHSKYEDLWMIGQGRFHEYYVDENGDFLKTVYIDSLKFLIEIKLQFEGQFILSSFGHLLKIVYAAYNNCLGRKREHDDYWILFHMHQTAYDVAENGEIFDEDDFERIANLTVIREPIYHCYSWVRRLIMYEKNVRLIGPRFLTRVINGETGTMMERKAGYDDVRAIKFEELKKHTKETIQSLCKWLQIDFDEKMLSTTLNGELIYFPSNTPEGIKYITGSALNTIQQKDFSEILTLWDEARLNIFFSKFKKAYGYDCNTPEFTDFDIRTIDELLNQNFKFADILQSYIDEKDDEEYDIDVNAFIKNQLREYVINYKKNTDYYDYIKP